MEQKEHTTGYGTCRYCGQRVMVDTTELPDPVDDEMLDRIASATCRCGGAEKNRRRREALEDAGEVINGMFGQFQGAGQIMMEAAPVIYDGGIKKLTIKIDEMRTAYMYKARGTIKIGMQTVKATESEIETDERK